MKIAVIGLWHLGCVTATCLAKASFDVIGYDPDYKVIDQLKNGQPPIFEPGLEDLLNEVTQSNKLTYTMDPNDLATADIVWATFDTPVDDNDNANVAYVETEIIKIIPHLKKGILIIISSQIPIGTTQKLQDAYNEVTFAYIPENLRLGKAIDVFTHPDRIVIGLNNNHFKNTIEMLLSPFSDKLIWMSIVSAEMTKHAINSFLALSVTFINELAALCETVGANAHDVERGLKSEERIGPKAYLRPGDAIAGGTLLRDINYLVQLGQQKHRDTFLISAVSNSNQYHKQWACRKLIDLLKNLKGKRVAILGLTYKAGTDTLRRSAAIEMCEWLYKQGAYVNAYDPVITSLSHELSRFIEIKTDTKMTLHQADAVIISTQWPEFRELNADIFTDNLKQPFVLDPSGFIAKNIGLDSRIKYFSVGIPS
jgi:UDPglucose 6-dehydrogenase